jgi:hypothetical protein
VKEGKFAMEGLIEKNEGVEHRNEGNGGQIERFGDLIDVSIDTGQHGISRFVYMFLFCRISFINMLDII